MHTTFAFAARLLWPLIALSVCSVTSAQTNEDFGSFPKAKALACPENFEQSTNANTGSGGRAVESQAFDYSLLQKKQQQLALQSRRLLDNSRSGLTDATNPPRLGPLTGQQKKLLLRAEAEDAPRFAVTSIVGEEGSTAESSYRSQPGEPIETPVATPLGLSTALGSHGQAPLQMQIAKATTGLATGRGPFFTSNTAPRPPRVRRVSGRSPSRALAIVGRSRGGCR